MCSLPWSWINNRNSYFVCIRHVNIHVYVIAIFCITIANPLIYSFFRPDVRDTVKYMFSKCSSHTPSDTVENGPTVNTSSTAACPNQKISSHAVGDQQTRV